jgi:hypothetical protein
MMRETGRTAMRMTMTTAAGVVMTESRTATIQVRYLGPIQKIS